MNKKVTWGIIALIAVIVIAGIAFMIDREENGDVQSNQQAEQAEKDIVWGVEDKLLSAYEEINRMQEDISDEKYDSLMSEYNEIEDAMFEMQDAYMDEKLNDEEFEEGLKNISDELDTFTDDLETNGQ